jgi:hypothetical protein
MAWHQASGRSGSAAAGFASKALPRTFSGERYASSRAVYVSSQARSPLPTKDDTVGEFGLASDL